jgi:hypothetical protein
MTKKEEERELKKLNMATALEEFQKTDGWEYLKNYLLSRIIGSKNALVKIDLATEVIKAAKKQAETDVLYSVFNWINNSIKEAEIKMRNPTILFLAPKKEQPKTRLD